MKEKVFFIKTDEKESDDLRCKKLKEFLVSQKILNFIDENDMVAVKSHFGEKSISGYVRPLFLKMIGELVKEQKGMPFLTETSTLYKGNRSNAVVHIEHANKQGFGFNETGMPIILADGLYGDEEYEIKIPGKLYSAVNIASLIGKVQAMIMISHFTGHMIAGFGAALKNMGMGCSSRKGKLIQHSTAKPKIKPGDCTKCEMCIKWCPADAITMNEDSAFIDKDKCIGCGECLAVCRFYAVAFNWKATYEDLQKKIVEHAWGVHKANEGKNIYINFLTRISKDCDCMDKYEKICPDIGIVVSNDAVAADSASLDLVEKTSGKKFSEMGHNIPYRFQIDYAAELGFGNPEYDLIPV